ncbi:twin-arginine translocase TatA/TatE family subunit [Dongia sp.]|uniref:twin-arginine translocase TatA/TatE family subunit n=1 Tax=Dongia sp. TaxID=1977262 RepID=UPI0037502385
MGKFSIWHLLIALAAVLVLFGGRGKISRIMADFAQGIEAFRQGLQNMDDPARRPPRRGLSPGLLLMAVAALAITIAATVKTLQQN